MNALFHGRATNLLIRIRAKPHHIKQSISLVVTAILFSVILFVWISSRDARSRELEVQAKTVSPLDGVASMFDGFVDGFKKKVANPASFGAPINDIATSTDTFDISGVVVIDPSATTTATTTATTPKTTSLPATSQKASTRTGQASTTKSVGNIGSN